MFRLYAIGVSLKRQKATQCLAPQGMTSEVKFFRISCTDFWIASSRGNKLRVAVARWQGNPKRQRAPEMRAIAGDLGNKSKAEARSRRNCWRGARSVSPDINPRLGAFVPTSMKRFKIGLSLKIFAARCSSTRKVDALDKALCIDPSTFSETKGDRQECLSYLKRLSISEVE
jgi:hypothetical protein